MPSDICIVKVMVPGATLACDRSAISRVGAVTGPFKVIKVAPVEVLIVIVMLSLSASYAAGKA